MDYSIIFASIITAVATLCSVFVGKKCMPSGKPLCPVTKDTNQSANVYAALDYILEEMKADRAYVLEFHNGGSYYSGRGQQKFSCTHEVARSGITRECNHSQDHRVSNYHSYIDMLIKEQKFILENIDHSQDQEFLKLIRRSGVMSVYNVPIKTLNGKIIGILGVDYVASKSKKFTEDDHTLMHRQAKFVAGYLI
jgi:hypothetical protein